MQAGHQPFRSCRVVDWGGNHPTVFCVQYPFLRLESHQSLPEALIVDFEAVAQDGTPQRFVGLPQAGENALFEVYASPIIMGDGEDLEMCGRAIRLRPKSHFQGFRRFGRPVFEGQQQPISVAGQIGV